HPASTTPFYAAQLCFRVVSTNLLVPYLYRSPIAVIRHRATCLTGLQAFLTSLRPIPLSHFMQTTLFANNRGLQIGSIHLGPSNHCLNIRTSAGSWSPSWPSASSCYVLRSAMCFVDSVVLILSRQCPSRFRLVRLLRPPGNASLPPTKTMLSVSLLSPCGLSRSRHWPLSSFCG